MFGKKDKKKKGKEEETEAEVEDKDSSAAGDGEGEDGEGDEKAGLSPKKRILIFALPLLLLIGGGAGLYFTGMLDGLFGKSDVEEVAEDGGDEATSEAGKHNTGHGEDTKKKEKEDKHKKKDKKKKKKKKGKHGEEGGEDEENGLEGVYFLKVPDIVVNLRTTGSQKRYLRLNIQLELKSAEDAHAVELVMPRVIDQFQVYLRELSERDLRGSSGVYRLEMELLSRVNEAAAPVEVQDVLFQEILIQ